MASRSCATLVASTVVGVACVISSGARSDDLQTFAILAGSAITNTGPSVINGNVGVSPGSAITGFPPGLVTAPYAIHDDDSVANLAQSDLTTAYNILAGRPTTADLTGQNLGGLTLTAGVYNFANASQLTGTLTLDGQGNPNAVFIFNVGSTLTTSSGATIRLINGAQGANIYYRVGSSATLGTATDFAGKIYALTSITLNTGADIDCGAALARNGAVTLDTNTISICPLTVAGGGGTGTGTGTGTGMGAGGPGVPPVFSSGLDDSASGNQRAVGGALDRYAAGGNPIPLTFQVLRGVFSPSELAAAFTELSGEAATGIAPAGIQAMDSFLSKIFDSAFYDDDAGTVPEGRDVPDDKSHGTVRALGYSEENPAALSSGPFGSLDRVGSRRPALGPWRMWAAGYGGQVDAEGNASRGSHDFAASTYAFAVGADYRVDPNTRLGFALAGGGTSFGIGDRLGGGRSDMIQAAVYSKTNFGAAYLLSTLAYSWQDVSTSRNVTIAGSDRLTAAFSASDIAGELEAGYRFGWFIPYAAIGVQDFLTPSYRERTSAALPSMFALSVNSNSTLAARTQLGFRVDQDVAVYEDAVLRLRGRAAWAHDISTDNRIDVGLRSLPGSIFTVYGASRAGDSLLFSAGPELRFRNGLTVGVAVDGQIARGFDAYSGSGQLRYVW